MSQQTTKIKRRINSVNSSLKVTTAMKMISTVKLGKWKNKMIANRNYVSEIKKITENVLIYAKNINSPFIHKNSEAKNKLYIVVTSTLGLCGAYNTNIFKVSDSKLTPDDDVIILGKKGLSHYKNGDFVHINEFDNYTNIESSAIIKSLTKYIIEQYKNKKYQEIRMIYSSYKNSLVSVVKDCQILPLATKEKQEDNYPPIMEPTEEKLVNSLIELSLKTTIYSKLLESEVSEHALRSNAMENATDNANEILDKLKIEFNKARQAAITQEITEVVSASNLL